ncbi:MAG: hypothetical protein WCX90_10205 [Thiohalomonadaceae bacterium]
MDRIPDEVSVYNEAAEEAVELGNRIAADDTEVDVWEVADGLLAGAIQYWLYSRQPCGNPLCDDCADLSTAEERLAELLSITRELATASDYFHTPADSNVGRA